MCVCGSKNLGLPEGPYIYIEREIYGDISMCLFYLLLDAKVGTIYATNASGKRIKVQKMSKDKNLVSDLSP